VGVITDLKKHVFAGEQLGKESVLPLCDAPLWMKYGGISRKCF
jgi:hypothetical protein